MHGKQIKGRGRDTKENVEAFKDVCGGVRQMKKEGRVFQAQGTACVKAQRSEIRDHFRCIQEGRQGIREGGRLALCAWAE